MSGGLRLMHALLAVKRWQICVGWNESVGVSWTERGAEEKERKRQADRRCILADMSAVFIL